MPDGTMLEPGEEIVNSDHITFYNDSLEAAAYNTWLSQTDFVILPYRKSSYYNRLSRVAIEAGARGIPLIYTDGTWTEEVAALVECGVRHEESPAELIKALNHAYESQKLKDRATAALASKTISLVRNLPLNHASALNHHLMRLLYSRPLTRWTRRLYAGSR